MYVLVLIKFMWLPDVLVVAIVVFILDPTSLMAG